MIKSILSLFLSLFLVIGVSTKQPTKMGNTVGLNNNNFARCHCPIGVDNFYSIGALVCRAGVQYECRSNGTAANWQVAATPCY